MHAMAWHMPRNVWSQSKCWRRLKFLGSDKSSSSCFRDNHWHIMKEMRGKVSTSGNSIPSYISVVNVVLETKWSRLSGWWSDTMIGSATGCTWDRTTIRIIQDGGMPLSTLRPLCWPSAQVMLLTFCTRNLPTSGTMTTTGRMEIAR